MFATSRVSSLRLTLGGSSCGWSFGCRPCRRMNLAICCMVPAIVYNVRALSMARALRRAMRCSLSAETCARTLGRPDRLDAKPTCLNTSG